MSPSWTSRTRVVVAPTQLVARRYGRGLAPKVAAEGRVSVAGPMSLAQRGEALAAVLASVSAPAGKYRLRPVVEVTILNAFHQVFSVPHSAALRSDDDWQRFASHRASELLGGAPSQWRVRLSPAGRGRARMAGALRESDVLALESTVTAAGAHLTGVRAALSSLLASRSVAQRAVQARDAAWLVVLEPRCLIIGSMGTGQMQTLSQRRLAPLPDGASAGALVATWLDREARLLGLDPQAAAGTVRCVVGRRVCEVHRTVGEADPLPGAIDRLGADVGDLEADVIEACFS